MSGPVDVTVWLVCGYAVFLLGAAYAVDRAARHTANRSVARRTGGFRYHPDHDAWRCPQDQWLWPHSFDSEHRVTRYRGSPLVCNACPVKAACTTSQHGREVSRTIDPWPSSEAERFHRGIACCIAVVAVLWPLAMALTGRTPLEAGLLCATAVGVGLGSWPLWCAPAPDPGSGSRSRCPCRPWTTSRTGTPRQRRRSTVVARRTAATGGPTSQARSQTRRWTGRSHRALEQPERPAGWSRIGRTP